MTKLCGWCGDREATSVSWNEHRKVAVPICTVCDEPVPDPGPRSRKTRHRPADKDRDLSMYAESYRDRLTRGVVQVAEVQTSADGTPWG